jgi:hypothetical protein
MSISQLIRYHHEKIVDFYFLYMMGWIKPKNQFTLLSLKYEKYIIMYDCTEEFVTKCLKIEQVAFGRFPILKLHVTSNNFLHEIKLLNIFCTCLTKILMNCIYHLFSTGQSKKKELRVSQRESRKKVEKLKEVFNFVNMNYDLYPRTMYTAYDPPYVLKEQRCLIWLFWITPSCLYRFKRPSPGDPLSHSFSMHTFPARIHT